MNLLSLPVLSSSGKDRLSTITPAFDSLNRVMISAYVSRGNGNCPYSSSVFSDISTRTASVFLTALEQSSDQRVLVRRFVEM